jgi:hypothetical protein
MSHAHSYDPQPSQPAYQSLLKAAQPAQVPLLHRAHELINGQRQQDYGDKLQNFSQTAMIWTGLLSHKLMPGQALTAEDVALCMMGLKMSRLAKTPDHKDSILDIAGYAGCMDLLQQERNSGKSLLGATVDAGAPTKVETPTIHK